MSEKGVQYRQGDVQIVAINDLPASTTEIPARDGQSILAAGEATGHNHVMDKKVADLFTFQGAPQGHTVLVVKEATVKRGDLIEGKVIETMGDGTLRFRGEDGVVIRFHPDDVEVVKQGVKVNRAYSPVIHPEHDAIPLSEGKYRVIQHQTQVTAQRRQRVAD